MNEFNYIIGKTRLLGSDQTDIKQLFHEVHPVGSHKSKSNAPPVSYLFDVELTSVLSTASRSTIKGNDFNKGKTCNFLYKNSAIAVKINSIITCDSSFYMGRKYCS
jgi:hypothetical protein